MTTNLLALLPDTIQLIRRDSREVEAGAAEPQLIGLHLGGDGDGLSHIAVQSCQQTLTFRVRERDELHGVRDGG